MRRKPLVIALSTLLGFSVVSTARADHLDFGVGNQSTYGSRVDLGGYYRNHSQSFGVLDIMAPLLQSPDSLMFADIRGLDQSASAYEGNFGIGFRQICPDQQYLYGAYAFYDRRHSDVGNFFNQATVGAELKNIVWSYGLNVYMPFGQKARVNHNFDDATLVAGNNAYSFNNILYRNGKEKALPGADAEIGYSLPNVAGFTGYLGGYYFKTADVPTISGPRVRVTYDLPGFFSKDSTLLNHVTLEGMSQHDNVRGTQWAAGVRLSADFGGKQQSSLTGLQRHMLDYIQRDFDVVSAGNTKTPKHILTNADGSPVTVGIATDQASLANAIDNNANVVAVRGVISGIQGYVPLNNDQTLTGGNYTFGNNINIKLSNSGTLDNTGIGGNPVVVVFGKNNTIRDINLLTDAGENSTAISNIGTSVGNLVINNVTTNNQINIGILDGSTDSNITITNNHFNLGNIDGAIYDGILDITADNGSSASTTIANNQFNIGNISDSHIQGIIRTRINNGATLSANIANNQISIGDISDESIVAAIRTETANDSTLNISGGIHDNTITTTNISDSIFRGIVNTMIGNNTVNVAGGIRNNTIQLGDINGSTVFGINNEANVGTLNISGGLSYNKISIGNINNDSQFAGIYSFARNGATLTYDGFYGNQVNVGQVTDALATSYYFDSQDNSTINVNVNNHGRTFSQANIGDLFIDGDSDPIHFNPAA